MKINKEQASLLAHKIYNDYPLKRGKYHGLVKLTNLLKDDETYVSFEKALSNYKAYLARETWLKPQYFSTFVNSGWHDYVEADVAPTLNDYLLTLKTVNLDLKFERHLPRIEQTWPTQERFVQFLGARKAFYTATKSIDEDFERYRSFLSACIAKEIGV